MRLGDFTTDRLLASRAETLAWRLLFGLGTLQMPVIPYGFRFGIIGTGIHSLPRESEKIVVLVESPIVIAGQVVPISIVQSIQNAIGSVTLPLESWGDVYVWGVADPVFNVRSGGKIHGLRNGTAGAPVHWKVGATTIDGILTAGHVAGSGTGIAVTSRGSHIGTVADSALPKTGGVDVAAIELTAPSPSPPLSMVAVTGATFIDLLAAQRVSGRIIAKTAWFYWPGYTTTYLDLYVTASVISVGGDSGSAVVLSGSSNFVGTLVGASSGSLIQDGRTQLGALTSLSGITL